MSFNPDLSQKGQGVVINRKVSNVGQIRSQKHLGMFLDFKLGFNEHLEQSLAKVNRGIAILRKLQSLLPREAPLTTYKSFFRPHFMQS